MFCLCSTHARLSPHPTQKPSRLHPRPAQAPRRWVDGVAAGGVHRGAGGDRIGLRRRGAGRDGAGDGLSLAAQARRGRVRAGVGRGAGGGRAAGDTAAGPGDRRATLSPAKVTDHELLKRLVDGRWRAVLQRGKFAGCVREARNSELLHLLRHSGSRSRRRREALRPEAGFANRKSPICNPDGQAHDGPSAPGPPVK